jgi:hypothetical protein
MPDSGPENAVVEMAGEPVVRRQSGMLPPLAEDPSKKLPPVNVGRSSVGADTTGVAAGSDLQLPTQESSPVSPHPGENMPRVPPVRKSSFLTPRSTSITKDKKLSASLKAELGRIFNMLDADHSGEVTVPELMGACGSTLEEAEEQMDEYDLDGNGTLDCDEFLAYFTAQLNVGMTEEEIRKGMALRTGFGCKKRMALWMDGELMTVVMRKSSRFDQHTLSLSAVRL